VNDQARALVTDLRAILERHPRAQAIDAHAGLSLQVHIVAVDDGAVDAFAAELELGPPARASDKGVSWYRAESSDDDASITVIGPRKEAPSGEAVRLDAGGPAPSRQRRSGTAKPPRSRR